MNQNIEIAKHLIDIGARQIIGVLGSGDSFEIVESDHLINQFDFNQITKVKQSLALPFITNYLKNAGIYKK